MQDEQMVEALTSHTTQEALTDGIGTRGLIRRFENLDATGLGNPREGHAKLAIIITDEILRTLAIRGSFPKLLSGPRVGGRSHDTHVDHFARVQFDVEEGKQRPDYRDGDRLQFVRDETCAREGVVRMVLLRGGAYGPLERVEDLIEQWYCQPESMV